MDTATLVARIQSLGGPSSEPEAEGVLRASLSALCTYLPASDRARLARELPAALRGAAENDLFAVEASRTALGAEVARACHMDPRFGVEQLEIACRAIAEQLKPDERDGLRRHLPELLAPLLVVPTHAAGAAPAARRPGEPDSKRKLAAAREGSAHPLSESQPSAGQSRSVARWDDASAERTPAGYAGDERTREGETLATGKPGSKRGLSDA